jgi:hypothetical protein
MKSWLVLGANSVFCLLLAASPGCDGRHCGPPPKVDAGTMDGPVDRIAVALPEAGADAVDGSLADRPDAGAVDRPDVPGSTDGNDSSVMVGVTFNSCPNIAATTASPPEAPVGGMIMVTVAANDPDPADKLTYAWTAPSGAFAMPGAPGTTYTCAAIGSQTLTVKVSDGQCVQPVMFDVICTGPDAGAD